MMLDRGPFGGIPPGNKPARFSHKFANQWFMCGPGIRTRRRVRLRNEMARTSPEREKVFFCHICHLFMTPLVARSAGLIDVLLQQGQQVVGEHPKIALIFLAPLGAGIGGAGGRGSGQQVVERVDVGESPWALQDLEAMARIDGGDVLVGVIQEELLAGDRTAQSVRHPELATVDVGGSGSVVLPAGPGIERLDVGEKDGEDPDVELLVLGHEILPD